MAATAVALLFTISVSRATVAPPQKQPDDPVMDAAVMVQQAFDAINHNDFIAAQNELDEVIHSKGFAGLTGNIRYRALLVASMFAEQDGQNGKAHDLAMRASGIDGAGSPAWMTRLSSGFAIGNSRDAARSLTTITRRWPELLGEITPEAIGDIHEQLQDPQDATLDMQMLDSLFDAGWTVEGVEPSDMWRDLALLHLQRHEYARATTVALRITSAETAVSMLVDKRFDPVTTTHLDFFDVDRMIAAEIKAAKARMREHSHQVDRIYDLQLLYLATQQYQRVLSISDAAVAHAEKGDGEETYTDFDQRYIWVLDNRFRAYEDEGRWKDAEQTEELAARLPEHGGTNVSQWINLANLYADLDQPDKAANAILELGKMSPIGKMQLENVKLQIAMDRKDNKAIASAMAYLRKHQSDDLDTWEDALLLRGKLEEAAALLIKRLQDPYLRNEALLDMQDFATSGKGTPVDDVLGNNWSAVTARPDVVAAMQKVGRVKHFDIMADPR